MVRIITNFRISYSKSQARFCQRLVARRMSSASDNVDTSEKLDVKRIRNFSIVAHVDHGKSTLADRLLELTGAIKPNRERAQVLDQLQVERERGITVKAVTASLDYCCNNATYLLNLIDTPGHVDFSNEVARSVTACQGVIMLVDANEGIQAQTVAVHSLAKRNRLTVIPVLNKVDLPRADPDKVKGQLQTLFDIHPDTVLSISAKKGWGVAELLEAVVQRIPPPDVSTGTHLEAHVVDTWHDKYRGVLCLAYIRCGSVRVGQPVKWASDGKSHSVKYLALLRPEEESLEEAIAGQVVMLGCGPRGGGRVGDALLSRDAAGTAGTAGTAGAGTASTASAVRHMVFAGVFPATQTEHARLRDALHKLALNDAAVALAPDSSPALGQGWRMGFLGLLHLDVFTQRLRQEYDATPILTAPSVPYKIKVKGAKCIKQFGGEEVIITNPLQLPDPKNIVEYYEPFVIGTVVTPVQWTGAVISLGAARRGRALPGRALDDHTALLQFELPLSEVLHDFHDTLKSLTSGFASFDYHHHGFQPSALARLDIMLNGVLVEELASIVHVSRLQRTSRALTDKLKHMIPRQMVQVAIQAVVGGKVYARETIKAYRKDVTAKLYGGDVTRRKKLLKQQAEGKKKMRSVANIQIPRDTFIDVLKR